MNRKDTYSELSSIRNELLERKDELVSLGQLVARFDEVDAEYGGSLWTLKQIYANFNILVGIESVESPSYNGVKTEQEPCGDCISREKALQIIRAWFDREATPSDLKNEIEQLPSVAPQPKIGHWIKDKCSVCGEERAWYGQNPPYCPDCGAKMQEVEE